MAPEQRLSAKNTGPTSDIYSLFVSFWVLITGEKPIDLFETKEQEKAFSSLPDDIQELLCKGCHFEASKRPSADELVQEAKFLLKKYGQGDVAEMRAMLARSPQLLTYQVLCCV